jgi:hypothetical protein
MTPTSVTPLAGALISEPGDRTNAAAGTVISHRIDQRYTTSAVTAFTVSDVVTPMINFAASFFARFITVTL